MYELFPKWNVSLVELFFAFPKEGFFNHELPNIFDVPFLNFVNESGASWVSPSYEPNGQQEEINIHGINKLDAMVVHNLVYRCMGQRKVNLHLQFW